MNTVAGEAVIEFEERKSRFIGYVKPVGTVSEAEDFIAGIRKLHPAATHNVPLYRVVENGQEYLKYNDDGEPSGTAGKPMADIALVQNVCNFVLVATRYFGGVKLGAGGLIRMYAKTAKLAFAKAGIVPPSGDLKFMLTYDYSVTSRVEEFLSRHRVDVLHEDFSEKVSITVRVGKNLRDEILSLYNVEVTEL